MFDRVLVTPLSAIVFMEIKECVDLQGAIAFPVFKKVTNLRGAEVYKRAAFP